MKPRSGRHQAKSQKRPVEVLAAMAASILLAGSMVAAQTIPPVQPSQPPAHPTATRGHHKPVAKHHTALQRGPTASTHAGLVTAAAEKKPSAPAAPSQPNWPVQQKPEPAQVVWDSKGLEIQASNSSLDEILHQVATDTGVKVQGLSEDQRIFGTYGPGPAREVLSKLLDGSGYNVLMIGDQGSGAPREIVLSTSSPASAQPAVIAPPPVQVEEPQTYPVYRQESHPTPIRNPFGDAGPPTPQEMQQEIQQRQQQIDQEQQSNHKE